MIQPKPHRRDLKKGSETAKKDIEFAVADYYGSSKERSWFVCGGPVTFPYIHSLARTLPTMICSVGGKQTDGLVLGEGLGSVEGCGAALGDSDGQLFDQTMYCVKMLASDEQHKNLGKRSARAETW
jgi:hypothetical protein